MRITQEITKVQPDLGVSLSGVENIARYLEDNMNADFSEDGFNNLAKHFLMLDTHKYKVSKDLVSTKLANGWVEIWVNSRLMSPITHIVNVVGNLGFNSLRVMEYGMAEISINKVPFFSSPDGVMFNEVLL